MSISNFNEATFTDGCGIVIDRYDNVYISNSVFNSGVYEINIQKIDNLGNVSSFVTGFQPTQISNPYIFFDNIGFPFGYLYYIDYYYKNIYKIDVNGNKTLFLSNLITPTGGIVFDSSNNLYYCSANTKINKVDSNGNTTVYIEVTGLGRFDNIFGIALDSYNNLYTTTRISFQNYIRKYNSVGILVNAEFISIPNIHRIYNIVFDQYNNMYVSYLNRDTGSSFTYGNYLDKYDSNGNFVSNINFDPAAGIRYFNFNSTGNLLFKNGSSGKIKQFITPPKPITCFKENTKILTNKGYVPIQDLRKGDLIITLRHGYKPIDMIGYLEIENVISEERIKDKLYICTNKGYPEIFEDLIMTGCHSILVDEFKEGEKEKTTEILGSIYVTDKKYRMPVCVDERASPYEKKGKFTVYHIALENKDYYMNYGIYANGLIVETCSKRFLKEYSEMTLIE